MIRASLLAIASTLALSAASAQDRGATINYEGAELAEVARDVALRTGRIFVIDPRLSGRVNIVSPPNVTLTPDEVWEVFLATLQVNGFAAVPIGDREYKLLPTQQAIREGGANGSQSQGATTVTRVLPLRYVGAQAAAANLRGLLGEGAVVTPIAESNSLIVVDTAANVGRIMDILSRIDVDTSVVRSVQLENAAASAVANTVNEIIASQPSDGRRPGNITIVPMESSNTIVLRGSPEEVARTIPIVESLDRRGIGQVSLNTIYLNHADAEEMTTLIQELMDSSFGEDAAAIGVRPSVAFHRQTNALIINGSPEVQRTVRSVIESLDIRRPQVAIEAVIVEIANSTARDIGVQYITGGDSIPVMGTNFTSTAPSIASAAGAAFFLGPGSEGRTETVVEVVDGVTTETTSTFFDTNDPSVAVAGQLVDAAVSELLNFNGALLGVANTLDDGTVYGALLSAIQSDSNSNVLSVPNVTLLDNETGFLQVGQEIPVVTGQAVGADFNGGFRTVERRDVGNILEVTPKINDGDTVELTIRLEISSIGAFTALTDDIITNESIIETVVSVDNGQTLVLGGLIDQDRRRTESKVPILGDIPILGNLFKGQSGSEEETTLMIFIRPTILRNGFDADAVTARKYDHVRQQQLRRNRDQDAEAPIDTIMRDYVGPGDYYVPGANGEYIPLEELESVDTSAGGQPPGE